jgi:Protein of unknown function (DUF1573).
MKKLNFLLIILFCIIGLVSFSSCKKKVNPTTVEIEDQDRHYYPIQQGEDLDLNYGILNTGDNPLVITEIQPSCGCIIIDKKNPKIVLPHKKKYIHIKYNSTKNVGYVQHIVRCYGNFFRSGVIELRFDVNVVPDADYTRDYEELYHNYNEKNGNFKNGELKGSVDGTSAKRGYYVGQP